MQSFIASSSDQQTIIPYLTKGIRNGRPVNPTSIIAMLSAGATLEGSIRSARKCTDVRIIYILLTVLERFSSSVSFPEHTYSSSYIRFSLLFGIIALGLGVFIIFFNGATKALTIIIGITLVLGSVGGMANAILASQAKKEYKAKSKVLDDADYTVDSTTTVDESDGTKDDGVKY